MNKISSIRMTSSVSALTKNQRNIIQYTLAGEELDVEARKTRLSFTLNFMKDSLTERDVYMIVKRLRENQKMPFTFTEDEVNDYYRIVTGVDRTGVDRGLKARRKTRSKKRPPKNGGGGNTIDPAQKAEHDRINRSLNRRNQEEDLQRERDQQRPRPSKDQQRSTSPSRRRRRRL